MRITENMVTTPYSRNLQRNTSNLAPSNLKLASQRQYNHASEDLATVSKVFVICDQITRTGEHINVVKNATGELETVGSNILVLNSISKNIYKGATKAGGTSSQDPLDVIVEELSGQMGEVLQTMNARYGGKFLFSSSINSEAPFFLDADRNLSFNREQADIYDKNGPDTYFTENKPVYLDVGPRTYASGMNMVKSGIKISTPGVDVLEYRKDENGHPDNLCNLIGQADGQLGADSKNGAMGTLTQLKKKQSNASIATSEIDIWEKMLERTQNKLETGLVNPQETQKDLEVVKVEAETITNRSVKTT